MSFGISSSCFYPMQTEEALIKLGELGVKKCEVFLNSPTETTLEFAKELNRIKKNYGIDIVSVHPFSSFAETYMLFSEYQRRFDDMLKFYKRDFEVTAELGAKISIIHGSKLPQKVSNEVYFERFEKLVDEGRNFGITVAQENVNNHLSENPAFLSEMRSSLGDKFNMVFDVKQAVRAGFEPLAFAEEFSKNIIHIHISDHKDGFDCLAPGKGNFDFTKLFDIMKKANYSGNCIIELYRSNYGDYSELTQALDYIQNL